MTILKYITLFPAILFLLTEKAFALSLYGCEFDRTIVKGGTIKSEDKLGMYLIDSGEETFTMIGSLDNPKKIPNIVNETPNSVSYFWTIEDSTYAVSISKAVQMRAVLSISVYTESNFVGSQRAGKCEHQILQERR